MTNYVGSDVIRLIGINHPDEIESDNHYETGTITAKLGNKVRIRWIDRYHVKDSISFEFLTNLSRLDKDTMYVKPVETDITDIVTTSATSDNSDITNITDILPVARETYIQDKALENELEAAKQDEADMNDNTGNPDNKDVPVITPKSSRKPRTAASQASQAKVA